MLKSLCFVGAFAFGSHVIAAVVNLGTLMPMGDSITRGNDSFGDRPGGYRTYLYRDLAASGYGVQFVGSQTTNADDTLAAAGQTRHEGRSGATIAELDSVLYLDFAGEQAVGFAPPDTTLLFIGINNLRNGETGQDAAAELRTLVNDIYADRPTERVIVSTLYHTSDRSLDGPIDAFNAGVRSDVLYEQSIGRDTEYVDLGAAITPALLDGDGLHPSDAGLQTLGDGWAYALTHPTTAVPEPVSLAGLAGVAMLARRRHR